MEVLATRTGKFLFFLGVTGLLLFQTDLFAALAPQVKLLNKYKVELEQQNQKFHKLKKTLQDLEDEISRQNSKYISGMNLTQKIGTRIDLFESELVESSALIKSNYLRSKKILMSYFANNLDGESSAESILQDKILKKLLAEHLKDLDYNVKRNKDLKEKITLLRERVAEYKAVEGTLYSMVMDLENKKRTMVNDYYNMIGEKKIIQGKISKVSGEVVQAQKPDGEKNVESGSSGKFDSPIGKFISYQKSKKGVDFKYSGIVPVLSVASGKVVYAGELASFGNVIMIDHGEELRSVFLGRFIPDVKKGDLVDKGAVMGYTRDNGEKHGTLYFEVRKKNQSQNTLAWLNIKELKKYKL